MQMPKKIVTDPMMEVIISETRGSLTCVPKLKHFPGSFKLHRNDTKENNHK